MHAVVLCAGLGTRLDPLTRVRAKPALPVAGEPLVRRIVRGLVAEGVTRLVVNLHHRPETITARLGDGIDLGAEIRYSWEQPRVLGSAGGPRQALPIIGADTFFLVNGDTLTDAPLGALAVAHRASGALVTMALVPNVEPLKYGGVRMAPDGSVLAFVPRGPQAEGSFHFIGVQVAQQDAFATLTAGEPAQSTSASGHYASLIRSTPGAIRGVVVTASFWDIGTLADYWHTSWSFSRRSAGHPVVPPLDADVTRSIVWDDVSFGAGASVDECIVTDGVHVPSGAAYRRAILMRGTEGGVIDLPFAPEPE
jgi:mannose-1-phosphate guanylyltransferase